VTGDDSRGSGLGLAIARQLVVAHGGEIDAVSVPGTGTTVSVRLPLTGG
jgi:signal transduction histidine kinase